MGIAGDWQMRVGREAATHLREDPDEVDVEAVAALDSARNIGVVVRVRVGRIREQDEEREAHEERNEIQDDRQPHGGAG